MFLLGLFYNQVFDIRIIRIECFILHFEIEKDVLQNSK